MAVIAGLIAAVVAMFVAMAVCLAFLSLIGIDPKGAIPTGYGWIVYAVVGVTLSVAVSAFQVAKQFAASSPLLRRFLGRSIVFTLGAALLIGGPKLYRSWQLHRALLAARSEIQKQLPITDGDSKLIAVEVGYTDWTYSYVVERKFDPLPFQKQVRNGVCASGMKAYISDGASYRYTYRDQAGTLVASFEIASCP